MSKLALAILVVGCSGGCAHSGMSGDVRTDITAKMESTRSVITDCYGKELKLDRKLKGIMDLTFVVTPKTGAFEKVQVTRDDMNDPQLEQCVTGAVGALKLTTPQKANISVPSYPLDFAPVK